MNIYETIEFLREKLEAGQNLVNDLMYGYKIITDPYSEFSKYLPVVLIEADKTEFIIQGEYGDPAALDHHISLTMFESAQRIDFDVYKKKVNEGIKKLIDKLMLIDDPKVRKIIPTELSHNEVEIGSLKCTGIVLGLRVRTHWED